jgi:two-component system phosphate regulon response regulator OmpR
METSLTILIVDRNPRIRQFLQREFASEGYRVILAKDGSELAATISEDGTLDLLIVDDEIMTQDSSRVVQLLSRRTPSLPFIIHGYLMGSIDPMVERAAATFVKKTGSLEELKRSVKQLLSNRYPRLPDLESGRVDSAS